MYCRFSETDDDYQNFAWAIAMALECGNHSIYIFRSRPGGCEVSLGLSEHKYPDHVREIRLSEVFEENESYYIDDILNWLEEILGTCADE